MKQWLLKLFGNVGEFLAVLFNNAIQQELKVVLPIAAKAVAQVAVDPALLTGDLRRNAALVAIGGELAKAQVQVGLSTVNLAIELAYTKFKTEQPTTPAAS